MSTWHHRRKFHWALKDLESGTLVGSREGDPLLQETRARMRGIAKFNKLDMRDYKLVKVRIEYREVE